MDKHQRGDRTWGGFHDHPATQEGEGGGFGMMMGFCGGDSRLIRGAGHGFPGRGMHMFAERGRGRGGFRGGLMPPGLGWGMIRPDPRHALSPFSPMCGDYSPYYPPWFNPEPRKSKKSKLCQKEEQMHSDEVVVVGETGEEV